MYPSPYAAAVPLRPLVLSLSLCAAVAGCAMQGPAAGPAAPESTLAKIKASGTITLGYRDGAIPFSYMTPDHNKPTGFSVDLCEHVVEGLQQQLGLAKLEAKWVPVTADNRVQQVTSGAVDLECGTTTVTLTRETQVDFSLLTFLDGGSFLSQVGKSPKRLDEIGKLRIAVSTGTTTEASLRQAMKDDNVSAELLPVKSHEEGLGLLRDGKADLYASDRTVLIGLALSAPSGSAYVLSDFMFSYEPYALMMRHDWDFRLAVNKELAALYRDRRIVGIFRYWFGGLGEPPDLIKALYLIQGIPQ